MNFFYTHVKAMKGRRSKHSQKLLERAASTHCACALKSTRLHVASRNEIARIESCENGCYGVQKGVEKIQRLTI